MNTKKNIFKNTIVFIIVFIIATALFFISLSKILNDNTFDNVFGEYIPISDNVDESSLNWEKIAELGGSGFVVDGNKVIRTYNKNYNKEYSNSELLDFVTLGEEGQSTFVFNTYDGNKFFLCYPNDKVSPTINFNLNKGESTLKKNILIFLFLIIGGYILIIYFIVRWLSYKINNELAEIYKKQERDRDLLFKGIAHDVKTPLAVILSYTKALDENLVINEKRESYLKSIVRNAAILNDRVDELLEFSSIDNLTIEKENKDILELVRRYVGDNYSYFLDNKAYIEILFAENDKFFVDVDYKLFQRLLQNLIQNSIDHNEKDAIITIDFKDDKLIFKDNGRGIDSKDIENIFDPLFTGDTSLQRKKLRGMGLANVKKICELHKWKISYKDGFVISF
ncbi:HAMP domain-containing sensor histidine kinase [uncultured Anaerococcus sp.]|uniref:sensor histidine kinase n=1 Tax=uncultured Anaerococcus sp. TaxID=293428 RepID=UPI00280A89BC|nr:HAMP domain-containing sensor histidine kinase [uncultured Anaerococcus sp.]MDU5148846.1 HAMP domain-containing sensor histidine kinase [Anaerococcus prevotii]